VNAVVVQSLNEKPDECVSYYFTVNSFQSTMHDNTIRLKYSNQKFYLHRRSKYIL